MHSIRYPSPIDAGQWISLRIDDGVQIRTEKEEVEITPQ